MFPECDLEQAEKRRGAASLRRNERSEVRREREAHSVTPHGGAALIVR